MHRRRCVSTGGARPASRAVPPGQFTELRLHVRLHVRPNSNARPPPATHGAPTPRSRPTNSAAASLSLSHRGEPVIVSCFTAFPLPGLIIGRYGMRSGRQVSARLPHPMPQRDGV